MKMEKKMIAGLIALMAVTLAHGDILLDGSLTVSDSLIGADGTNDLRGGFVLTDSDTGLAIPLAIGETFNMEFTLQAAAVGSTMNGDQIGYNGIGWAVDNGLKIGFGNGNQAFGMMFDVKDYKAKIELGGDISASGPSSFGLDAGKTGEITTSLVKNTENEMKYAGDTATFNVSVTHTAYSTFDMEVAWGAETFTHTMLGIELASVREFYIAMNNLDADLGYQINVASTNVGPPVVTNPPYGEVSFSPNWDFYVATSNMAVLAESSDGFSVEMTSSASKRFIYKTGANGFNAPFQVGETATWSFTAEVGSSMALNPGDIFFQGSIWDSGVSGDNGVTFQVDWGTPDVTTMKFGSSRASSYANIGAVYGANTSTDIPSNALDALGKSADFVIVMERISATDLQVSLSYDDAILTNSIVIPDTLDSLNELGFRFKQSGDNALIISSMMLVITNPNMDLYDSWVSDMNLTVGVNDGRNDDPDSDTMDNLLEYALGGNPLLGDAAMYLPVESVEGSYLNLVYRRRLDAGTVGLDYNVYSSEALVFGPITNATEEAGSAVLGTTNFEAVTNRVPTNVEARQFMQLNVSEQ